MNNKLTILIDSLDKKIDVLKRIQAYNEVQEKSFLETTPNLDSFDQAIEQKDALIEELILLDEGFDALFAEVKEQLAGNRDQYRAEIEMMQSQIRTITELSNAVQVKEARNKKLVEEYFRNSRAAIKKGRQHARVAYDYYKSMSGSVMRGEAQYLDSKN